MDINEQILKSIYDVVDQVNKVLSSDMRLEKSPKTVLIGQSSKLDSLGYINFIIAAESQISETFNTIIDLTNQDIALQDDSLSIAALVEYISSHLANENDG